MWFYHKESDVAETITHLETGVQVLRSGESDLSELWFSGQGRYKTTLGTDPEKGERHD